MLKHQEDELPGAIVTENGLQHASTEHRYAYNPNTEPLLQSMACMFEEKERNASCERRSMNTATEHEYARTEHCYRACVMDYFS